MAALKAGMLSSQFHLNQPGVEVRIAGRHPDITDSYFPEKHILIFTVVYSIFKPKGELFICVIDQRKVTTQDNPSFSFKATYLSLLTVASFQLQKSQAQYPKIVISNFREVE